MYFARLCVVTELLDSQAAIRRGYLRRLALMARHAVAFASIFAAFGLGASPALAQQPPVPGPNLPPPVVQPSVNILFDINTGALTSVPAEIGTITIPVETTQIGTQVGKAPNVVVRLAGIQRDGVLMGEIVGEAAPEEGEAPVRQSVGSVADAGLAGVVSPYLNKSSGVVFGKLTKVARGTEEMQTIDLYGDGLINMAVDDATLGQMVDQEGQPVAASGDETSGTVYMTTGTAAKVIKNVINMQGVNEASSFVVQNGEFVFE